MTAMILLEYHFIAGNDGKIYCNRVIDYNYLKRYLSVFDDIILVGRLSKENGDCSDKLLVSGENVKFVPLEEFVGIKGIIKNYRKIMKTIKNVIPQVSCVIMRAPNHLSLITYRLFKRKKIPFALEFNIAANKFIEKDSLLGNIINKFVVKEAKKMCLTANGVAYVTEEILQKTYPCRALLEPDNKNYFTASYSTIELDDKMRKKQNWSSKPKVFNIIHTGYMDSYRKGQVVLIKAISEVIKMGITNIHVTLVGDGQKRKEFEGVVNNYNLTDFFSFTGLIKRREDLTKILAKQHFFVFPTQSEGLPRSIIEAMSVGLVCLSSPVDGVPELLEEEMLIDYNDYLGYANKIVELINDFEKMKEISNLNYRKVEKYRKEILDRKRKKFYLQLKELSKNRR